MTAVAAHMGGAAATAAFWAESAELARDAELLRLQVVGLTQRARHHLGSSTCPAALVVDAGQTAAAGLLGLRRILQARGQ